MNKVIYAISESQVERQLLIASCLKWRCQYTKGFYFHIDEIDELLLLLRKIKYSAEPPVYPYVLIVEAVELLTNDVALRKEVLYLLRQISNECGVPVYYIELIQECKQSSDPDIFDITISVDANI